MADIASLGIVVKTTGAKEATRDLKALEKEAKQSEVAASKLGKAWGAALGAGAASLIVGGVTAIVKATIEADRVQGKLEARVKALGASSARSADQISMMADSLQAASTFDDEGIKEAATALLSFTNIRGDNFDRTLKNVLDLAEATGTDLPQAAEKLGKALNSPATAARQLRDIGIELSKQQKALIKDLLATGRGSEAQALLLAELEKRYAGTAAAARNTLGGALKGLKNDFGNLLEGDGSGVKGMTRAINDLADTLRSQEVKDGFSAVVNGLFQTAKYAADAIAGIGAFSKELKALSGFSLTGAAGLLFNVATGNAAGAVRSFAKSGLADFSGVSGRVDSTADTGGAKADAFDGRGFEGGGSGKKGRGRKAKELPDFSKEAAEELKRLIEQERRATESYRDMAAILDGPLAEAQREHQKRVEEINELAKQSAEAAQGRDALLSKEADRYAKETAEIERQLNPLGLLLEDMEFELDLIGRGNAEREVMNLLREQGIDLMSQEAKGAITAAKAFEKEAEAMQATVNLMDDFRFAASDALTDFVTGAKSAKDALKDFFDSVAEQITRAIAEKWVAQLFGQAGTTGQGTQGGGWLNAIMGLFTGSAGASSAGGVADLFASGSFGYFDKGGYTGAAGASDVTGFVHGKEFVIDAANTRRLGVDYLGHLNNGGQPAIASRGPVSQTFVTNVQGRLDRKTEDQLARKQGREARRAMSRTG